MEATSADSVSKCQLVRVDGEPAVYLELDGELHHVPNPATYNNLFTTWGAIQAINSLDDYCVGEPLSDGANLMSGGYGVFLVSNGMRRWITDP